MLGSNEDYTAVAERAEDLSELWKQDVGIIEDGDLIGGADFDVEGSIANADFF